MTSRRINELDERLERMTPPKHHDSREVYSRAVHDLTPEEQSLVADAIHALEIEFPSEEWPTEAWLATRPLNEQAAIRKVLARVQELEKDRQVVRQ